MEEQTGNAHPEPGRRILIGRFSRHDRAEHAVERLFEQGFPMDMISFLGRAEAAGDDLLGVYYTGLGDRVKGWALHGALWGGLWGLITTAAGMFMIPGVGPIIALGPIVEVITATVTGATLAGGAMAGAAALSRVAVAFHRIGVPRERLHAFQEAITGGEYLLILRCGDHAEAERWERELRRLGVDSVEEFPYVL